MANDLAHNANAMRIYNTRKTGLHGIRLASVGLKKLETVFFSELKSKNVTVNF